MDTRLRRRLLVRKGIDMGVMNDLDDLLNSCEGCEALLEAGIMTPREFKYYFQLNATLDKTIYTLVDSHIER